MLRRNIPVGPTMVRKTTKAIAVLHGFSWVMGLLPLGLAKLLHKTRTPTLFDGAHFIIFGSILPRPQPTALPTSVSLRLDLQLVFKSRRLPKQIRRRAQLRL